jgi:hypothetical protein
MKQEWQVMPPGKDSTTKGTNPDPLPGEGQDGTQDRQAGISGEKGDLFVEKEPASCLQVTAASTSEENTRPASPTDMHMRPWELTSRST